MKKLDALLQKYNAGNTPGLAVMVIHKQKILWQQGYGLAHIATKRPIHNRSNFNLASVSKAFTGLAIAQLEERGLISASESIKKYFPCSKMYEAIQIRDLIYHSSGLPHFAKRYWQNEQTVNNQQIIEHLKENEYVFPAGTCFEYNDVGYILLASLVEQITAIPFEQYVSEQILLPCGMHNTAFLQSHKPISERVCGYTQWPFFDVFDEYPGDNVIGDGGIYSSLDDLFRWAMAIENAVLCSAKTRDKLFSPGIACAGGTLGYGYGWFIDKDHCYHQGEWIGFRTQIAYWPHDNLWIIILSNCSGTDTFDIKRIILSTIGML